MLCRKGCITMCIGNVYVAEKGIFARKTTAAASTRRRVWTTRRNGTVNISALPRWSTNAAQTGAELRQRGVPKQSHDAVRYSVHIIALEKLHKSQSPAIIPQATAAAHPRTSKAARRASAPHRAPFGAPVSSQPLGVFRASHVTAASSNSFASGGGGRVKCSDSSSTRERQIRGVNTQTSGGVQEGRCQRQSRRFTKVL